MKRNFQGGIFFSEEKKTSAIPLKTMPATDFVVLPLFSSRGEAAKCLVRAGDRVLKGQKIAQGEKEPFLCPVHASVSGLVKEFGVFPTPEGEGPAVLIENDYREEICPESKPFSVPIAQAPREEIISFVGEKGIVEGKTGSPLWEKLKRNSGKVHTLILDFTESEPILAIRHRLLSELPREVMGGTKILLRALSCEKAVFVLEEGREDEWKEIVFDLGEKDEFSAVFVSPKYPQGEESLLAFAVSGKRIPHGSDVSSLGYCILEGEACRETYQAFVTGLPQIQRYVTVGGDCVRNEANLLVPLGVSFAQVLQRCGGLSRVPDKFIAGGPMKGLLQKNEEVPVTKTTRGIVAITSREEARLSCVHCGRCVLSCPMGLIPFELVRGAEKARPSLLKQYYVGDCMECGVCTYVCPSHIPLLDAIRKGKEILKKEEGERNG